MLTKKAKYGLKAMAYLAGVQHGQTALVADIATNNQIPKKFLDAILSELRNAGYVHSKKGKGGGYMLARPPAEISVGNLVRTLDGPLAPIQCASRRLYRRCEDCVDETHCAVRLVMMEARDAISRVLDNTSLDQMRALGEGGLKLLDGVSSEAADSAAMDMAKA
ncbi:MAG: transcriptional regulator [Methylocystis sp.]|nr:MAG: transcriptional regulator [Methylocystis sp.]